MNPKVVQKLMGHQHYSTTIDIYTHVMQDDIDSEVCKLESAIVTTPEEWFYQSYIFCTKIGDLPNIQRIRKRTMLYQNEKFGINGL